MDFLDYYRENLRYLRTLGAEFASEFPKVASRLNLSEFECPDPYVERLLEGTAFLSARVEKKLDDGYKRLLESVLSSVSPDALYPVPSGALLELSPDSSSDLVKKGACLRAGSVFDASIPSINTPCRFATIWKTPLTPIRLLSAEYITRDLSKFNIGESHAAALYMKFALPNKALFSSIAAPELLFFLNLPDAVASVLMRQMLLDMDRLYVSDGSGDFTPSGKPCFEIPVTTAGGALLSGLKGNLKGLRALQNFLSYPAFFRFILMKNLGDSLKRESPEIEILLTFNRREPELTNEIKTSSLKLNCAPVLNLFRKRSDRAFLDREAYEFHIVPERTAMRDFEVYSVRRLEFFNEKNETLFSASNFYDDSTTEHERDRRNFFSVHRRKSLFSRKAHQRSSYTGTEVFISVSGQNADLEEASQFAADLICTNRDLPLLLAPQAPLTPADAVAQSASFIVPPTRPNYPLISKGDTSDWARVSHIIFNLSGMLWQNGTFPLEMLKTLLRNYNLRSAEEMERMLDGITALKSEPTTFRFIRNGAVFFETGWKIQFVLNEQAYAGTGFYVFALVLKEIFNSFTPLNSLLEVQLFTQQSGHIATWKTLEN